MKLSDAVILGSVSIKMQAGDWNHCGLGVAATACGVPEMENERWNAILDQWPWLSKDFNMMNLARMFDTRVATGEIALEEFVAHIRSIEPPCGGCCDFDCVCVRAEILREKIGGVICVELEASKPLQWFDHGWMSHVQTKDA